MRCKGFRGQGAWKVLNCVWCLVFGAWCLVFGVWRLRLCRDCGMRVFIDRGRGAEELKALRGLRTVRGTERYQ